MVYDCVNALLIVTKNKIVWDKFDSKQNFKKYRVAIRMVHNEVLSKFEESVLSHRNKFQYDYPLKHMRKVVDETDTYEVTNKFFKHWIIFLIILYFIS